MINSAGLQTTIGRRIGIVLLTVFVTAPMLWVFGYALLYSTGAIGLFSDGWTTEHWRAAYAVGGLPQSLLFTPFIAGTVTLLAVCMSLGLTLVCPELRHSRLVVALVCVLLATPSAVMGVMVYQVLNSGGYLARLAFHGGWINSPTQFPALVNDRYAVGMIVAQTLTAVPLLTLFFFRTWTSARVDRYCRLARSLGATSVQARQKIALPMLLQRGRSLILLIFILNLGSYEIPLLLGSQSPQMFSVLTQRRFGLFDLQQRPQAFVLAVTYFLFVSACVMIFLNRRRTHG